MLERNSVAEVPGEVRDALRALQAAYDGQRAWLQRGRWIEEVRHPERGWTDRREHPWCVGYAPGPRLLFVRAQRRLVADGISLRIESEGRPPRLRSLPPRPSARQLLGGEPSFGRPGSLLLALALGDLALGDLDEDPALGFAEEDSLEVAEVEVEGRRRWRLSREWSFGSLSSRDTLEVDQQSGQLVSARCETSSDACDELARSALLELEPLRELGASEAGELFALPAPAPLADEPAGAPDVAEVEAEGPGGERVALAALEGEVLLDLWSTRGGSLLQRLDLARQTEAALAARAQALVWVVREDGGWERSLAEPELRAAAPRWLIRGADAERLFAALSPRGLPRAARLRAGQVELPLYDRTLAGVEVLLGQLAPEPAEPEPGPPPTGLPSLPLERRWRREALAYSLALLPGSEPALAVSDHEGLLILDERGEEVTRIPLEETPSRLVVADLGTGEPTLLASRGWGRGLVAYDPSGQVRWRYRCESGLDDVAALPGDEPLIAIGHNGATGLHGVDVAGQRRWVAELGNVWSVVAGELGGAPRIVATEAGGSVRVFDREGRPLAEWRAGEEGYHRRLLLGAWAAGEETLVFATAGDEQVVAFTSEGELAYRARLPQEACRIQRSPAEQAERRARFERQAAKLREIAGELMDELAQQLAERTGAEPPSEEEQAARMEEVFASMDRVSPEAMLLHDLDGDGARELLVLTRLGLSMLDRAGELRGFLPLQGGRALAGLPDGSLAIGARDGVTLYRWRARPAGDC